jgi:hypothetical protein
VFPIPGDIAVYFALARAIRSARCSLFEPQMPFRQALVVCATGTSIADYLAPLADLARQRQLASAFFVSGNRLKDGPMNGIRPDASGYDIFVDGIERSHRDHKETAYEAATFIKKRAPALQVTIRDRATGCHDARGWSDEVRPSASLTDERKAHRTAQSTASHPGLHRQTPVPSPAAAG